MTKTKPPAPLYHRIKLSVLAQIRSGELKPGDRVGSENELGAHFGASRPTVQRALRDLVSEGLLRRVQGSGTFVTPPGSNFSLLEVHDLGDQIRARGGEPRSEVLIQRRRAADPEVIELLELDPGADIFHAVILQASDGVPVAHEERFARVDVFTDFLEQDFSATSVFAYLSSRSVLEEIENVVRAIHPDRRLAQLLEVDPGEPCLHLQRRNWWQGRAVTLTRITYAGGRQALASRYKPLNR